MWVSYHLRMELMDECLRKWPAFLMQDSPWRPAYQQTYHSDVFNGNGLLFHMTQPISRSTIKAIACSKLAITEH